MPKIFDLKDGKDKQLAEVLWTSKGYSYPISEIERRLHISDSFVKHKLLKELNYVVYSNKFVWSKCTYKCQCFVNKDDLNEWLNKNATFEKQTQIINLELVLSPYKSVLSEAKKMFADYKKAYKNRGCGYREGTIPRPVLDYLNEKLVIYNADFNISPSRRSEVNFVDVKPIDLLDNRNIYIVDGSNREKYYKEAFIRGDIKVKIGSQITLFIKNTENYKKYGLPYLIPMDKKVYVAGRK